MRVLTPEQVTVFLDAIRGDRLEALYVMAIGVGLRQGEILGLAWNDIDLELRTIRVRHALQRVKGKLELDEPKSVTSRRVVPAPRIVLDALRAHRTHQLEARLLAGSLWHVRIARTDVPGTHLRHVGASARSQARDWRPRFAT